MSTIIPDLESKIDDLTIDKKSMRALRLLSVAFFIQATMAMSVVGAFGAISTEWKLSTTDIALLVTAFGATFAITAPILQILFGHWERRTQILAGLAVMAGGAFLFGLAPNYATLVASRIVMGLGAALVSPVISAMGSSLVKPKLQGAALAIVIMGFSIASVIGVPASAWISLHAGARWLYIVLASFTLFTALMIRVFVPDRTRGEAANPRLLARMLTNTSTMSSLMVVFSISAAIFAIYTVINPILRDVYGASPELIFSALLAFGIAGLLGNLVVAGASKTYSSEILLRSSMLTLAIIFLILLVAPISIVLIFAALIAWPFVADMIWPSQQRRMVEIEPAARGLALALNASFLFSGIAAGSALGGFLYSSSGFAAVIIGAIALIAMGVGFLQISILTYAPVKDKDSEENSLKESPWPA